jgi:hypothetical protein
LCQPNIESYPVTHIEADSGGGDAYTYLTMTGSLNEGFFSGIGPDGRELVLIWDELNETWFFGDPGYDDTAYPSSPTTRCDPLGGASDLAYSTAEFTAIVGTFLIL